MYRIGIGELEFKAAGQTAKDEARPAFNRPIVMAGFSVTIHEAINVFRKRASHDTYAFDWAAHFQWAGRSHATRQGAFTIKIRDQILVHKKIENKILEF